jgi:hypothetical protein
MEVRDLRLGYEPKFFGLGNRLAAIVRLKLAVDVPEVGLDRVDRDDQRLRDLLVG